GPTTATLTRRIASILRSRRTGRGQYKASCARRLSMTRQRFTKIENGEARLYLDEVEAIMLEFSIGPEEIWVEFATHQDPIYRIDVPAGKADNFVILVKPVKGDGQG
ncbi:MAG TPA: hypothetical protein VF914_08200, partial [Chloroflexia bacterium]